MSAIYPCGDRVLMREYAAEEKSPGGIVIPEQAKRRPGKAKVLSVGDGVEEIQEGDVVWYNTFDVTRIELEGAELAVIEADKILLRLTDEREEE